MAKIIDGKAVAKHVRAEVAVEAATFRDRTGITPHLAAVIVGEDPASKKYVGMKRRDCAEANLGSSLHELPATTTEAELLELVASLNADPVVHGILVQLPLPEQIDEQAILDAIDPLKDVDCFHPHNVGLLAQGRPRFLPCTPHGVQRLLVESGTEIAGAHVVVLGRSEIVGKPMGLILVQKAEAANATVTICHSRTKNLAEIARTADILISAIGRAGFVTADMVKPGAVVIDVGTNFVDGKLVGDVEFDAVASVASAITPVPGGVGPMTRAMLLKNTLTAADLLHHRRD